MLYLTINSECLYAQKRMLLLSRTYFRCYKMIKHKISIEYSRPKTVLGLKKVKSIFELVKY